MTTLRTPPIAEQATAPISAGPIAQQSTIRNRRPRPRPCRDGPRENLVAMRDGIPTACVLIRAGRASARITTLIRSTAAARTLVTDALRDVDGGRMDGFIRQQRSGKDECTFPEHPA